MVNYKVLIVASFYYEEISKNLIEGAKLIFKEHNIDYKILTTNGSFEIPFLINRNIKNYDAFVALGCIIKGETYHFELISNEVTRKIMDLSVNHKKPIGFGILTCENLDQAIQRSDLNHGNKGKEAAQACVRLINENKSIKNKLNG